MKDAQWFIIAGVLRPTATGDTAVLLYLCSRDPYNSLGRWKSSRDLAIYFSFDEAVEMFRTTLTANQDFYFYLIRLPENFISGQEFPEVIYAQKSEHEPAIAKDTKRLIDV